MLSHSLHFEIHHRNCQELAHLNKTYQSITIVFAETQGMLYNK